MKEFLFIDLCITSLKINDDGTSEGHSKINCHKSVTREEAEKIWRCVEEKEKKA